MASLTPDRELPRLASVYTELRRVARDYLSQERAGHTLQPTALVHEAFLRLAKNETDSGPGPDRRTLVAQAARAMRLTLVDYARRRNARKRCVGGKRLALDQALECYERRSIDLVALDSALERLAGVDTQLARIVELRFFGGMTTDETAATLNTSPSTVVRGWRFARMWLFNELQEG